MNRAERRKAEKQGYNHKTIMDKTLSDTYESGYKAGMKAVTEIVFYMTAYSIQMEFGLGRKRLQRAMKRVYNNIDAYRTNHLNSSDEEPKPNTFGSNNVAYEIYYSYETGIMRVIEIEAFGDRTLVTRFQDRRGRGITEDEMLENIKQITNMTYKEFKEKILKRGD